METASQIINTIGGLFAGVMAGAILYSIVRIIKDEIKNKGK